MEKSKKVIYIGRFGSQRTASGIRVRSISRLFSELGYEVVLLSNSTEAVLSTEDNDDFPMITPSFKRENQTILNALDVFTGIFEFSFLKKYCKLYSPEIIVIYNETAVESKKIISYARRNKIKVLVDTTEWYEQVPFSKSPLEWFITKSVDRRLRKTDKLVAGTIAISPYLHDHYKKLGVPSILIPPIFNIYEINKDATACAFQNSKDNTLRIIYAGAPGTKDIIVPVLDAITGINSDEVKITFNIYGLDKKQLDLLWGCQSGLENGIVAKGKVSHREVLCALKGSHYSILLRHDKRYAKAGYSTKMAESLSVGTPVICNKIGGSDLDITDGYNGFLVENSEEGTIAACLQRLVSLPNNEYIKMRNIALNTAMQKYDKNRYLGELEGLLNDANNKYVLFFVDDFKGGAGNVVQILAKELVDRGYNVKVCCVGGKTAGRHDLSGVEVIRISCRLKGKLRYLGYMLKIRSLIKKEHPDTVISFLFGISALVAPFIDSKKINYIVSERSDPRALWPHGIFSRLTENAYRKATKIVTLFRCFNSAIGEHSDKCVVIPNPVPQINLPIKEALNSTVRLVTIANDSYPKGLDLLIEAMAECKALDVVLNIYGKNDGIHLQDLVEQHSLEDKVLIKGYTDNVYAVLDESDIYIMPSRHEGFPNSLCEAMSAGKPCIAFRCHEGIDELIENMVDGITVEKESVQQLYEAIAYMVSNPDEALKMGQSAQKKMARYNTKLVVDIWDSLI